MSTPDHVCAQVWLDGVLCAALDAAARGARTSRADLLRRIIIESVRASGHLTPSTSPRRHRGPRRAEAA